MINIVNRGFDGAMQPLVTMASPWSVLIVLAFLSSLVVLLIFRWTSTPAIIRHYKNITTARLLEFLLYRDDPVVSLGAFPRLLVANGHYLKALLRPMLISLIPMLFIIAQLSRWLEVRPLHPGEVALVKVVLKPTTSVLDHDAILHGNDSVGVESPPIRIPLQHEIVWRIRGYNSGGKSLQLTFDGESYSKEVKVTPGIMAPVSRQRLSFGLWNWMFASGEKMIPGDVPIQSIRVCYPANVFWIGPCPLHWLVAFFVLTLGFALLIKGFIGVEV